MVSKISVKHFVFLGFAAGTAAMINAAVSFAADFSFSLNNQTSADLVEFYASPKNSGSWGNNILRNSVSSGEAIRVTVPDRGEGCVYNILGVFDNGTRLPDYDVNICGRSEYTFTD